ncbi:hypothetical protein GJR95_17670 [Spirosoma endbachense]|uniref:Carboxypeptidase regulatory-like domain-containing protein n=2 Tax=Spirosoma endbachense TaxID=2666025 RepID=A0A6P1VUH3_9BACT|nr:hypothetical protein GJR95_17670 [Spirosoma endbachense]
MLMKIRIFLLITTLALIGTACKKEVAGNDNLTPQQGFVSGRVVDTQGNPIANASIVVNNTQYYNHNILGRTDASGRYKLELTPGSWYIRGTTEIKFDNKRYVLDLYSETDVAFSGTEGAVRNLSLKIAGERTGEFGDVGYYGGQIEVVGLGIDTEAVELTLQPVGALMDGMTGKSLTAKPDRMYIDDVPLGKYTITARYGADRKPLRLRILDSDRAYGSSLTASFDPAYSGAQGRYKLNVEVAE